MTTGTKRLLFWAPRVLGLLFAAFVSLFALDVFQEHHGFWDTTRALLLHLIPTAILLVILAISWRWEWVGGLAFPALGTLYLVMTWGKVHWSAYAILSGSLFLVGALFLIGWRYRAQCSAK